MQSVKTKSTLNDITLHTPDKRRKKRNLVRPPVYKIDLIKLFFFFFCKCDGTLIKEGKKKKNDEWDILVYTNALAFFKSSLMFLIFSSVFSFSFVNSANFASAFSNRPDK